jgi:hypothetical protein
MTPPLELVGCVNCGHSAPMTEELAELSFAWLDQDTCKTSCPVCGTYSINRAWTYENGYPIAGQFLVVKTFNRIRKG